MSTVGCSGSYTTLKQNEDRHILVLKTCSKWSCCKNLFM